MKRNFLHQRSLLLLTSFLLLFGLMISTSNNAEAQPLIPKLSLVGSDGGYDRDWYPDGFIYQPASISNSEPRTFLMPVFIENAWKYSSQTPGLDPEPIKSFEFEILYDSSAVRAIGIQKFGPRDEDLGYDPLAKHFNLSWDDKKDQERYKKYIEENVQYPDKQKGRVIRITGTSSKTPLPTTQEGEYKVLLYVKFRVVPTIFTQTANAPIYVGPDSIEYNDVNVRKENPFQKELLNGNSNAEEFEPKPETGLAGIDFTTFQEKYKKGVIWIKITRELPEFLLTMERGIGQVPALIKRSDDLYEVADPITIDSASVDPIWGTRNIRLYNGTSQTRMLDVDIVTDEPWLKLQSNPTGTNDRTPSDFSSPTREGHIRFIDEDILGEESDAEGNDTDPLGDIRFRIICDPNEIDEGPGGEKAGIYVGYITFMSSTAKYSPVRVKVTFIYFRNPVEWFDNLHSPGINLTVKNSCGDESKLIFGTGHRATNNVDSLFGEFAWDEPMDGFGARFLVPDHMPESIKEEVPWGFGDWSPNDEDARTTISLGPQTKQYGSRDIRSNKDTLQSIIYKVGFDAGGDQCYPIVIEWDTTDFPEGSALYLRDSVNGGSFNVNMREATPLGDGKFSYTIHDPRWTSFLIEYTLPHVIRYVNEFGEPIIENGWNLLSLPVRPINPHWKNVYPNAVNKPIHYFQSDFEQEEILQPGIGYFVKYPEEIVDTMFAGTFINDLINPTFDPIGQDVIRLYIGWNTIGSVSKSVSVEQIDLDPFDSNNPPSLPETMRKGIYAYETQRGYVEVSQMNPGLGYWMYVDKGSYLNLQVPAKRSYENKGNFEKEDVLETSKRLVLRDNGQHETNLYLTKNQRVNMSSFELPPTPPYELFDVRFANGTKLENSNNSIVKLQGVDYPLSLNMRRADANYTFKDPVTGETFGTIEKGNDGSVKINRSSSNAIRILRSDDGNADFALSVYPNPVESITNINYTIAENQHVVIKLFDAMGNELKTLLDSDETAGSGDVKLNVSDISSGTYICKMTAGGMSVVRTITVAK